MVGLFSVSSKDYLKQLRYFSTSLKQEVDARLTEQVSSKSQQILRDYSRVHSMNMKYQELLYNQGDMSALSKFQQS